MHAEESKKIQAQLKELRYGKKDLILSSLPDPTGGRVSERLEAWQLAGVKPQERVRHLVGLNMKSNELLLVQMARKKNQEKHKKRLQKPVLPNEKKKKVRSHGIFFWGRIKA
ncbi:uncharacterized protein LOC144246714 [Lonchura striata]